MNVVTKTKITLAALALAPLAVADDNQVANWSGLEAELAALEEVTASPADDGWSVSIKDGLNVQNADGTFTMKFGGRIQLDAGFHSGEDGHPLSGDADADGVEARRARLFVSGKAHGNTRYKAEYDFAGAGSAFKDVYIQFDDVFDAKVGLYKESFSLEELTSSRYITFLERSQVTEALAPSRNFGVGTTQPFEGDGGTWSLGVFKDTDDDLASGVGDGEYALTGRITVAPVHDGETGEVIHLGVSGSLRKVMTARFRARPEMHLVGRAIDTSSFAADETTQFGLEAVWQNGPFSAQAEYMLADTDTGGAGSDPSQDGYYVQGSYFLTGEHRPYSTSAAAFGRVNPESNFQSGGGNGAWEVAARVSHLSLEDPFAYADEQDNVTLGLNWYMNKHTRLMLNYVTAELDSVSESVDALLIRWQIDF